MPCKFDSCQGHHTMKKFLYILLFLPIVANAATESELADLYCKDVGGIREVVLQDKTRVDCLTDRLAIEVDWANKWYEGIGQSLHYAMHTGRLPAVVLLTKSFSDTRYVQRARMVIDHYGLPIKLFVYSEGIKLE
jgi:hypothetical protein